jgi:hypothetical protein
MTPMPSRGRRRRHVWRWAVGLVALASLALVVTAALGGADWVEAPYRYLARELAWAFGDPEDHYNFGEVVPGRVYRSALPDERFIRHLHDRYGVRKVISLNGPRPFQPAARELGMKVYVLFWKAFRAPSDYQLQFVLDELEGDEPVLVHCTWGRDRTGYAVASLRVQRQAWPVPEALAELVRYGHDPDEQPWIDERVARVAD